MVNLSSEEDDNLAEQLVEAAHTDCFIVFLSLQSVWYKMCPLWQTDLCQRLGQESSWQCLSPCLLCLLFLQKAAVDWRGVWPGGRESPVPDSLRYHDREPETCSGERYVDPPGYLFAFYVSRRAD